MDYLDRKMLLSVIEFFYRYLPTMIYIGGRIYIFNLKKEFINDNNYSKINKLISKPFINP